MYVLLEQRCVCHPLLDHRCDLWVKSLPLTERVLVLSPVGQPICVMAWNVEIDYAIRKMEKTWQHPESVVYKMKAMS